MNLLYTYLTIMRKRRTNATYNISSYELNIILTLSPGIAVWMCTRRPDKRCGLNVILFKWSLLLVDDIFFRCCCVLYMIIWFQWDILTDRFLLRNDLLGEIIRRWSKDDWREINIPLMIFFKWMQTNA